MSHRIIPSSYVKSVLHNGVGRHMCQLQRLTLKFCKSYAGSKGMRDFIENNLLEFTRHNPGVVVYLQPRRHRTARLVGEYLNQERRQLYVDNYTEEEICQWVQHLRDQSGVPITRLRQTWHTENPSIQGIWTPTTNRDPSINITQFPNDELSSCVPTEKTATELLLERAGQLRIAKAEAKNS